ncbi:putative bifunctional diguanylate cyclase/phosphodiesterase [Allorhizobium undicola]|uniref:putative bifunctional diguanylate cyclase/phosphodiesterase n=1 Tax=Allorhizobium undicola TaxID=78527 RepID=UPI0012B5F151|nr:EAL domain-containing protein [Allorhizobium undicola]
MKQAQPLKIEAATAQGSELPTPAEVWRLYRTRNERARASATRSGLWVSVLVYLMFAVTDFILLGDVAVATTIARFCVGIGALSMIEFQVARKASADHLDLTCALALICGYAFWLYPALGTSEVENMRYYMVFGAIFMMGANLFFSFEVWLSILTSCVVLGLFFMALLTVFVGEYFYAVAFGTFYVACFTFTTYVNLRLNKERYQVFLNALEAEHQHREATERGRALFRLSHTDYLTGIDNRRAIDQRLREYWNAWQTDGTAFSAILVDVDFFKKYNDCYGHQAGDRCLILVTNALNEALLPFNASLGRYGGEEFIVLVRVGGEAQVLQICELIRATVEKLALVHDQRRDGLAIITVSVGATYTREHMPPKLERMITEADRSLYSAKANGRNCVHLFDPTDPSTGDESENIAALLKVAVNRDLVSLVYQPIYNLENGTVAAAEALMRLKMLDGSPVSPALFIPVAERTGSIIALGLWSIRKACEDMLVSGKAPVVSVNVSPLQLKARGFAEGVRNILTETGIEGHRLAFEITEGIDMEGQSDILRCLKQLEKLGIRIWLDDFGTGFAGLSWLRLIQFHTVKIDRSFLVDCDSEQGKTMLRDIISLIRHRGNRILVEGIETEEQLALMREFRIDDVQGYFTGRPMPPDLFVDRHSRL